MALFFREVDVRMPRDGREVAEDTLHLLADVSQFQFRLFHSAFSKSPAIKMLG